MRIVVTFSHTCPFTISVKMYDFQLLRFVNWLEFHFFHCQTKHSFIDHLHGKTIFQIKLSHTHLHRRNDSRSLSLQLYFSESFWLIPVWMYARMGVWATTSNCHYWTCANFPAKNQIINHNSSFRPAMQEYL